MMHMFYVIWDYVDEIIRQAEFIGLRTILGASGVANQRYAGLDCHARS